MNRKEWQLVSFAGKALHYFELNVCPIFTSLTNINFAKCIQYLYFKQY